MNFPVQGAVASAAMDTPDADRPNSKQPAGTAVPNGNVHGYPSPARSVDKTTEATCQAESVRELRAGDSPKPMNQMRVVCSWCGEEMQPVPCAADMAHLISHGMCDQCANQFPLNETESGIQNLNPQTTMRNLNIHRFTKRGLILEGLAWTAALAGILMAPYWLPQIFHR